MTQVELKRFGPATIGSLFYDFNRDINEIWEDYLAVDFYLKETHQRLKCDAIRRVPIERLVSKPRQDPASAATVYGIIDRITRKSNGRHAFLDAVSRFEHLMSGLVVRVYMDYPGKIRGMAKDAGEENVTRRAKLFDLILDSADRYEMIQKLVEEKVRGIFYGNPLDLFGGNKADIGFADYFKSNHRDALELFAEVTARRNIFVHNQGRIDRKYLAEVKGTNLVLGQAIQIDRPYLQRSLLAMKELAAASANQVATNIYKEPLRGRAAKVQAAALKLGARAALVAKAKVAP